MSNPDSFIDEVSEEIRRDRLYGMFRKYGWIAGVAILGIVGGTAWVQWDNARKEARAQAFGDQLIEALDIGGSADDRRAALAAIEADGLQEVVLALIMASDPAEDKAETLAALDRVLAVKDVPAVWRDLAVLRRVTVAGVDQPLAERRAALEDIAIAGRPYRALAAEHLAYLLAEEGNSAAAIDALNTLIRAEDSSGALRARAAQIVTALGGTAQTPSSVTDMLPEALGNTSQADAD